MKRVKEMSGRLLDEGNDRFRATFLMKSTRALVGWALTANPHDDWLQSEEHRLIRDYRSARAYRPTTRKTVSRSI